MGDGFYGILGAVIVAIFIPLLLSSMVMGKKKGKHKVKLVDDRRDGATTMAELFEQSCREHSLLRFTGTRKLISRDFVTANDGKKYEKLHLGEYEWETYGQIFERVCNFASGLIQFGHDPDSRVAIFSDTRAEWLIAFQGCFRQNITVVTIYASLGDRALIHSLNEAQVSTVICDSKLLKKVTAVSSRLRTVKNVIYFEDESTESSNINDWASSSLSEVEKLGKKSPVHARLPIKDEIAMIMYRSGNTGLPKGVVMTHANILATTTAVMTVIPRIRTSDVYLAYLPLAHIFELASETVMLSAGCSIGYGSSLTLIDTSNKIKEGTKGDASTLKPTLMASVPSILDRVRDSVSKKFEAKGDLTTKLFHIAYKRRLAAIEGSWFGAWGLEKLLWDAIFFNKIGSILGGRIRFILSGGAPITGDIQQFINVCMGVPIGQGYGLTETCAGAAFSESGCFTPDRRMPRSEVLFGGVGATSGYFDNHVKAKQVNDKWMRSLSTSDMDRFLPSGRLELMDRKKDYVKLKHGEYISLGKVEAVLAASDYVDNIMLHAGPFHSYCVALVVPLQHVLENWAQNVGISYDDFAELCGKPEAVSEVQQSLSKVAKEEKLNKFEIPAKIMLVAEPWTPESGLVTDALRLKRKQLRIRFRDDLQNLYR